MRRWVVAVLLLLAGCSAPPQACTEIGSVSGVSVTVLAPYAAQVDGVRLEVCWAGQCQEREVELAPGSDTVDQGCSGPDPEDICSATAVPNGTLVGFVEVPGLPAERGHHRRDGHRRRPTGSSWPRSAGPPRPPTRTGHGCGAGGNQAAIEIDRTGIS